MSLGKRRQKILDGEAIFKYYYIEMGDGRSYNKLTRWASEKWGPNPVTGKDWTTGAVWQAAWRWVLDERHPEHVAYARKIYAEVLLRYGENLTDEDWNDTLSQHAKTCMTKVQYRRFLAKHPGFPNYETF